MRFSQQQQKYQISQQAMRKGATLKYRTNNFFRGGGG